jgi:hypothetical protein
LSSKQAANPKMQKYDFKYNIWIVCEITDFPNGIPLTFLETSGGIKEFIFS